jgi:hypothetical protein
VLWEVHLTGTAVIWLGPVSALVLLRKVYSPVGQQGLRDNSSSCLQNERLFISDI